MLSSRLLGLIVVLAGAASLASPASAEAASRCFGLRPTIAGTQGDDRLQGTPRVDVISAEAGDDVISAADGDDWVCAGAGHDRVLGGAGEDTIDGESGNDGIQAGPGEVDTVGGGPGNDTLSGQGGAADVVVFAGAPNGVRVDLARDRASGEGADTLHSFEGILGSHRNDALSGDEAANILIGYGGSDRLVGRGASDWAIFFTSAAPVMANLLAHSAKGEGSDSLRSIEWLGGSDYADTLVGDGHDNLLFGGLGNDTVSGGNGDDIVAGLAGNDELRGQNGVDLLSGDPGDDLIDGGQGLQDEVDYTASATGIRANLPGRVRGSATGEGNDSLRAVEGLLGSDFSDELTGNSGSNLLLGEGGEDDVAAGAGDDSLGGGPGADSMTGGAGADSLQGGPEVDNLAGGSGADSCFQYDGSTATCVRRRDGFSRRVAWPRSTQARDPTVRSGLVGIALPRRSSELRRRASRRGASFRQLPRRPMRAVRTSLPRTPRPNERCRALRLERRPPSLVQFESILVRLRSITGVCRNRARLSLLRDRFSVPQPRRLDLCPCARRLLRTHRRHRLEGAYC
jgi:Ca2+-binding RTX toxin-like protein